MSEQFSTIQNQLAEVESRGNESDVDESAIADAILDQIPESSTPDTNASDGKDTVSVRFPFETELSPEFVAVFATHSNGSEVPVGPQYWGIQKRAGQGDVVVVDNYPLGDAQSVEFRVDVAKPDGFGSATKTVENPTFDGTDVPLDALRFDTLRPDVNETVGITVRPTDPANFKNVTGISVTLPNGTTISGSVTGSRTAEFTTRAAGSHHVEISYQNPAGDEFTVATGIEAASNPPAFPAGLRIASGPAAGTFAIVGDGLRGGAVDVRSGGSVVDVTATLEQGSDLPEELHVYTTGASLSSTVDLSVRVSQGPDREGISSPVRVVAHLQAVPDGTLLRRNGEPLPMSGSDRAEVQDQPGSLVVKTWSDREATLDLSVNTNPGTLARLGWRFDQLTSSLPSIPGSSLLGVFPLVFIPSVLWRRRSSGGNSA